MAAHHAAVRTLALGHGKPVVVGVGPGVNLRITTAATATSNHRVTRVEAAAARPALQQAAGRLLPPAFFVFAVALGGGITPALRADRDDAPG